MKILLFNLGSVEKRIIGFDIKGYKPILEHDVVLWGPIPDKEFIYNGRNYPIISFFEQISINNIIERLPAGWIPDVVTCDTSVVNFVPDIHLCPYKTILFTRDAWADTIFNRSLVELFDFISHSVIDISNYKSFKVRMLPLASYPVSIPEPGEGIPDYRKRSIDVIAIANYDDSFYHDRFKTFYRLSESNNSGLNIKYFKGLRRDEIHRLYKESRIVIDWAHTLSNRSYEAALNGCLLFSHEKNTAMNEFWIPGDEYVAYNDENLYELVCHYTRNHAEAERIISNAARKIRSAPLGFGEYTLESVKLAFNEEIDIHARIDRTEKLDRADFNYRISTPLLYNYRYETDFPLRWKETYYRRIDLAISACLTDSGKIDPLIQASRISFLLKDYDLSLKYLDELGAILPGYGWLYYLKSRIFREQGRTDEALTNALLAVKFSEESPALLMEHVLPVIEKGNSCDGRRITDYLWQDIYKHNNEFQVKSALHLAHALAGDIQADSGNIEGAIRSYYNAIKQVPVPSTILKEAPMLIARKDYEKLLEITNDGLKESPYDSLIVLYNAYALTRFDQRKNAVKVLISHRRSLKGFAGIRRTTFTRYSLFVLIILQFFGKAIGRRNILRLAEILTR